MYCTGNNIQEIKGCEDKYCPFFSFRYADISHSDEKEITKKLLGKTEVLKSNKDIIL